MEDIDTERQRTVLEDGETEFEHRATSNHDLRPRPRPIAMYTNKCFFDASDNDKDYYSDDLYDDSSRDPTFTDEEKKRKELDEELYNSSERLNIWKNDSTRNSSMSSSDSSDACQVRKKKRKKKWKKNLQNLSVSKQVM